MSENPQEQTEAKLLAFIEGELDEAGRADIARHLEANPKHRKLLDDLAAGRRLLRQLPRESAPPEVFEGFESQLERHVLLADATPVADVNPETGNLRLRQRRWVKIRAAAAAVILATGIGIVVVKSLPDRHSTNVAALTPPPPVQPKDELSASQNRDSDHTTYHGDAEKRTSENQRLLRQAVVNGRPESLQSDKASRRAMAKSAAQPGDQFADRNRADLEQIPAQERQRMLLAALQAQKLPAVRALMEKKKELLAERGPADATPPSEHRPETNGHEPLFLVVSSADPEHLRRQVADVLNEQGVAFSALADLDGLERSARVANRGMVEKDSTGSRETKRDEQNVPSTSSATGVAKGMAAPKPPAQSLAAAAGTPPAPGAPAMSRAPAAPPTPASPAPGAVAPSTPSLGDAVVMPTPTAPASVAEAHPPAAESHGPATSSFVFGEGSQKPAEQAKGTNAETTNLDRTAGIHPATRPSVDGVLIVRRIPRSIAEHLVEELNRPQAAQFAATYRRVTPSRGAAGGAGSQMSANSAAVLQGAGRFNSPNPAAHNPVSQSADLTLKQMDKAAAERESGGAASPATHPSNPADPIVPGEALSLVYPNLRGRGKPISQTVTITPKGTVYVLGPGEVPVAGLTLAQASERITQAMQKSDAKSAGAELRRSAGTELAMGLNDGARPDATNRNAAATQETQLESLEPTGPRNDAVEQTPIAAAPASPDAGDPLVDVVIVLQQRPGAAGSSAIENGQTFVADRATQPAAATPATRPSQP